ncbi:hypothetical protein MKW98_002865 [Papaver atlanticum]|uniref:Uncharacterized protein n=1 Tax=Papaver atlanticum TaxID=357466 RepID=A0AAD4SWB7_9MAGN|nr:hypothetical protein MKW98_002865 [Papaver atlanticum]
MALPVAADVSIRPLDDADHGTLLRQHRFHGYQTLAALANGVLQYVGNAHIIANHTVLCILLHPHFFTIRDTVLLAPNIVPGVLVLSPTAFRPRSFDTIVYDIGGWQPRLKHFLAASPLITPEIDREGPQPIYTLIMKIKSSAVSQLERFEFTLMRIHNTVPTHRVVKYLAYIPHPAVLEGIADPQDEHAQEGFDLEDQDMAAMVDDVCCGGYMRNTEHNGLLNFGCHR